MSDPRTERLAGAANERELEAAVAELVVAAGARPEMPAAELAAVKEAARATFAARYAPAAPRSRRATALGWGLAAAAAALALALGAGLWRARSGAAPAASPAVARIELVRGAATLSGPGSRGETAAAVGGGVAAGSTLTTGSGATPARLALGFAGGLALRLDAESRLRVVSAGRVLLERGAVYVDAAAGGGGAPFEVETASGVFHHVGTQFEVRLLSTAANGVRLRVREGRVVLDGPQGSAEAGAGEELRVRRDGALERAPSASWGADWEWVLDASPTPPIEGWTVARFLDWYGRESGLAVSYEDAETAEAARRIRVHGSLDELAPRAAAEAVLASAGFGARAAGGRLAVEAEALAAAP